MMGWLNIPFNPANIMTLALGHRHRRDQWHSHPESVAEERTPVHPVTEHRQGRAGVGVDAIAGFGSLIIAKDRGIHSLGCVMAAGIALCMIAGLTFFAGVAEFARPLASLNKSTSADKQSSALGQEEPR